MRTVFDHIDRIKEQPYHVRERVAFMTAGLITGVIGLGWLGISLSSGAFAIQGDGFAQATGEAPFLVDGRPATGDTTGLAGAAAALPSEGGDSAPAHVDVVPSGLPAPAAPASGNPRGNQTIIPF